MSDFDEEIFDLEGDELRKHLQGRMTPDLVLACMRLKDAVDKVNVEKQFQQTVMATMIEDDRNEESGLAAIDAVLKFAKRYDDIASSYRQLAIAMQKFMKRHLGLSD